MGTTKKSAGKGASSEARPSRAVATRAGSRKPAAARAAGARATRAKAAAESAPVEVLDAEGAYEAAQGEAKALAAHEVRQCRSDSAVAVVNVQQGVAAVLERVDELGARFSPGEIAAVRGLPARALAFSFAAAQVEASELGSDGTLGRKLVRARALRRQLLRGAEACAEKGVVPAGEVVKIREGKGPLDTAQDCVQLAAFYRRHAAALAGKTPASDQDIAEAASLGSALVAVLRPRSARPAARTTKQRQEAAALRDRIWTLLARDHEWLWKMGAILWGKSVDEHVPPLQSRAVSGSGGSADPAPAPTG